MQTKKVQNIIAYFTCCFLWLESIDTVSGILLYDSATMSIISSHKITKSSAILLKYLLLSQIHRHMKIKKPLYHKKRFLTENEFKTPIVCLICQSFLYESHYKCYKKLVSRLWPELFTLIFFLRHTLLFCCK